MDAARRASALAAVTAVLVIALDQLFKALVRADIAPGEQLALLGPLELVHVRNTGVAFGALAGAGWPVLVLVAGAIALLLAYFARRRSRPLLWLPTGVVLGGAIGNVIDRVRLGAVTDYLSVPHWPAFNLADIAITVGVVLLVLIGERPAPASPPSEQRR